MAHAMQYAINMYGIPPRNLSTSMPSFGEPWTPRFHTRLRRAPVTHPPIPHVCFLIFLPGLPFNPGPRCSLPQAAPLPAHSVLYYTTLHYTILEHCIIYYNISGPRGGPARPPPRAPPLGWLRPLALYYIIVIIVIIIAIIIVIMCLPFFASWNLCASAKVASENGGSCPREACVNSCRATLTPARKSSIDVAL